MKKVWTIVAVALALLVVTSAAFAGPAVDKNHEEGGARCGTSGDYPPFSVKAKDGKLIGFDVDLAGAIAESHGRKAEGSTDAFSGSLSRALRQAKIEHDNLGHDNDTRAKSQDRLCGSPTLSPVRPY